MSQETPIATPLPFASKRSTTYKTNEWKIVSLKETPLPQSLQLCDTPDKAVEYWHQTIAQNPYFDPERECFAVLILNTRRKIRGHQLVSMGTMDSLLIHPRDVFRLAIMANAAAIICMHNHPSGDSSPSEADIRVTRDLARAGQLLRIELLDHVIVGKGQRTSLRELGYLSSMG